MKSQKSLLLRSSFVVRPKHVDQIANVVSQKLAPKIFRMMPVYTNGHGSNHTESDSDDSDAVSFYPYELKPLPTQVSPFSILLPFSWLLTEP